MRDENHNMMLCLEHCASHGLMQASTKETVSTVRHVHSPDGEDSQTCRFDLPLPESPNFDIKQPSGRQHASAKCMLAYFCEIILGMLLRQQRPVAASDAWRPFFTCMRERRRDGRPLAHATAAASPE